MTTYLRPAISRRPSPRAPRIPTGWCSRRHRSDGQRGTQAERRSDPRSVAARRDRVHPRRGGHDSIGAARLARGRAATRRSATSCSARARRARIGALQIQARGTLAATSARRRRSRQPAVLLALDATIEVASVRGLDDPYSTWCTGYRTTQLAADELIVAATSRCPPRGCARRGASRHPPRAVDLEVMGRRAITLDGEIVVSARSPSGGRGIARCGSPPSRTRSAGCRSPRPPTPRAPPSARRSSDRRHPFDVRVPPRGRREPRRPVLHTPRSACHDSPRCRP